MNNRVKKIFNNLAINLDVIIIKNATYPFIDDNFFYFTGLENGLFEASIAALYPDGKMDIILPKLEEETARSIKSNLKVYNDRKEWINYLKSSFSSLKNIGLNYSNLSYKDFFNLKKLLPNSKFIDISEEILKSRLIKDEIELNHIKKSCSIADKVMKKIPDMLYENVHEYEVAAEIDYLMQRSGADKPAFETISSFSINTAQPHYSHGNTRLKNGDFALFDIGASFKKYNSDISRTFVFGKADKKQKEMYETVLEAQKKGFNLLKPNIKTSKIHNAVSSYIEKTKFKGRFIHSTGHSLGLSVHDGGRFSSDSKIILKKNMVFTIEPGIYIPGFGGVRIEDDILITDEGFELLTKTSKAFLEI